MTPPVFFDTETDPTDHAVVTPRAAVAAVAVGESDVGLCDPAVGRWRLQTCDGPIVGHATAFDLAVLGIEPRPQDWERIYDTQIRAVIAGAAAGKNEKASSSLADLARPLGIKLEGKGSIQLSFGGKTLEDLTPEQRRYAEQDVVATRAVWLAQGGERRMPDEVRQTRAAFDVWRMARRGVRLDVPRVQALLAEGRAEVTRLRDAVIAADLMHETGPKKAREWTVCREKVQARLEAAGVTKHPKRRAQDPRPPSELLDSSGETLRATEDPGLVALADFKDAEKWVSLVEAFDVGPVARAFWKPMVASGRISASRPNLTQVPKGPLRACVIPSEGNVLVCADYSELEFRAWADVCSRWLGWSDAADAYRAGRSPHLVLGAQLAGISYDEAVEAYRRDPKWGPRQDAKAGNYGLIGGMGVPRLAATYGLTEERAGVVNATWLRTWGEARSYFRRIKAGAEGEGRYRVKTPWSGRERLGYYSEAANHIIQATGADVAKEALMRATRAGLPVTMLIHDEIVLDVPRAQAEDAARELERVMVEAGEEVCPNVPWTQKADIRNRWA